MKKSLLLISSLLAAGTLAASADATWIGGSTITSDLWANSNSWEMSEGSTFPTGGSGPGTPDSNCWETFYISNATGSIGTLEGWTLGIVLSDNAELTVSALKKLQGGCSISIDVTSSLTINSFGNPRGNDGGTTTLTNYGVFNLEYVKEQGGDGFNMILGSTGIVNFTSNGTTARTAKVATVSAEITNTGTNVKTTTATGIDGNAIVERTLITLDDYMTFATEGAVTTTLENGLTNVSTLTEVDSYGALQSATAGAYYISKSTSGLSVFYVIPEPSMFGLFAGTLALGLAGTRRRRK